MEISNAAMFRFEITGLIVLWSKRLILFCRLVYEYQGEAAQKLEPISKLLEKHGDAGELDKPEGVRGVVLPANKQPPFPLEPGKEAFDELATFIAA